MTKGIRTIYKTLRRKLNIEPHELHYTAEVNIGALEG